MSHELKELTSQEIELIVGADKSPAQAAESLAKISQPGHPSTPEQWETQWPPVIEEHYIRRAGDYILDILPESDARAKRVIAYVLKHMHERTF